jgi:Arc/MetJ-type ribon-helix-helix transcriptional regulator
MSTLTVRLPDAFKRDLLRFCKQQGTTTADFVRESLRKQLAASKLREDREYVMSLAKAKGILTDEDVFKAIS